MLPAPKSRLERQTISAEDWRGANLSDVSFVGCTLCDVNLAEADIAGTEFFFCNLLDVNFSSARISGLRIRYSSLYNVSFREAVMPGAYISFSGGGRIDLYGAEMPGGTITHSYFFNFEAARANLKDTWITYSHLSDAYFDDAVVSPQLWHGSHIPHGIRGAKLAEHGQARIAAPPRFLQLSDSFPACVLHTEEDGPRYFSTNQEEITAAQFAASLRRFCKEFNIPLQEIP